MNPFREDEGAVVEHLICIGTIAAVGRLEEVLANWVESGESHQFFEEGNGLLELNVQLKIIDCSHA